MPKFKSYSVATIINTFVCCLLQLLDMVQIYAVNMASFTPSDLLAPYNPVALISIRASIKMVLFLCPLK